MVEKVALIELSNSHDECLLSQLHALKERKCHITLICPEEVRLRNPFFSPFIDVFKEIQVTGSALEDFRKMKQLIRYLKSQEITKVIFNTAQGGHVRNLCLLAPKEMEFTGIIHTLKKFKGSFTQRIIDRKIKKYLVLNDWFLQFIPERKGRKIRSFYPLRFPELTTEILKPENEIWIAVIGGVENRRKDLNGSIPLISELPGNCKVIFLGKSDPEKEEVVRFRDEIKERGLSDRILTFDHFVEPELFDAYLKCTDLIWTMIHPDAECSKEYFSNQIPGALNIALGYKIPMLNHAHYTELWEDLKYSVAYRIPTFKQDLEAGLMEINAIKKALIETDRFSADLQEKKYADFVLNS